MIGTLNRDIEIEWSQTGRIAKIRKGAKIDGEAKGDFFYFKWRNIGAARLSIRFFEFS